jgi:lysine-specific demethylase/histidyl-hydroxylase NO66
MLGKLVEMAPVDAAADQMASECVHSSMPPILPPDEFPLSSRGRVAPRQLDITGACDARVVSQRAGRLVLEDGVANVYHTIDNAKWYQGEPPQFISFTLDDAPGIEYLLASYPEWKPVCTIPGLDTAGQIELAQHLYDVGILLVKEADDSDDDEGA